MSAVVHEIPDKFLPGCLLVHLSRKNQLFLGDSQNLVLININFHLYFILK